MNRINPIHIAILLIVILLFVVVRLGSLKNELTQAKSEYKKTEEVASKILGFKEAYGDKKELQKSLKKLLSLSQLRSAKLQQKIQKNSIILSSQSMDKNALNTLMGKLLNKAYNISAFKIKKQSSESVSFEMEIKW